MKKFYLSLLSCVAFCSAMAQVTVNATGGVATQGYGSISAAFLAINNGTHTGAITVEVSANTTEGASCVLHSSGAGSANYTSVTIRPTADNVTISGPSASGKGLIELNGADNVTIDGDNPNTPGTNRNLTITNSASNTTTLTSVIRLVVGTGVANTDNVTIKNCIINGSATGRNASGVTSGSVDNTLGIYGGGNAAGATSAPSSLTAVNNSSTGTMNNLVIDNNAITSCARGISVNGASQASINSITVSNNTLGTAGSTAGAPPYFGISSTIYTVAITIQGATLCTVSGNTIQNVMSCNGNVIRGAEIQGTTVSNLQFVNNTINGVVASATNCTGDEGLYIGGSMTTCNISGNTITNIISLSSTANASGINLNNGTGTTTTIVSGNKVSRVNNHTASAVPATGINVNGPNNVQLNNNMVWDVNGRAATAPPSTSNENMGIKVSSGTGHKVYNNTVHMYGGPISGSASHGNTCFMIVNTTSTGMDVRNNIFSMQMTGWPGTPINSCIQLPTGLTASFNGTFNNNAYYAASGNYLAQMTSGTTRYLVSDLVINAITPATNWRSYSSTLNAAGTNDNASLAFVGAAPFIGANTDMHISNASATPLESGGATVTGVTTDIDGQVRPGPAGSVNGGANMPDIGADEFDGIPQDIIPPSITYTALAATCIAGDRTLNATVTDNIGVPLSGANVPRIYYRKGAGTWSSSSGAYVSGTAANSVWTFTISATDMGGLIGTDQVSYYVVAQDAAGKVGATPGIGLVATDVNTVTTPPTTPNIYFVQPNSGTFDVGIGKPFTTITAAVNSYNTNTCLTGHIVYNLTDASYPTESYPITIANNPMAGASATLTIKPATGVAVSITSSSGAASVIRFTDARYVTIDGVNTGGSSFTITNGNAGNTTGNIWLSSVTTGNNNIALRNLTLVGGNAGTAGADEFGIFASNTSSSRTDGANNDDVTIAGNSFEKCGYAVWAGGTSGGTDDNWVITNNIVGPATSSSTNNVGVNAMFFRNMTNLNVSNNTLRNIGVTGTTFGTAGIYMEGNINRAVVANNNISNHVSYGTSNSMSINIGSGVINARVSGNKITTIFNTNGSPGSMRAIELNGGANCNDTIMNNMISEVYSNSSATTTNWPMGIFIQGSTSVAKIWHNSIHLFGDRAGTASTAAGSACIMVTTSGNNIDLRNNILVNTYNNTGIVGEKSYAIYSTSASSTFSAIDNNNYTVSATNFMGLIGGTDRTIVAEMQSGFGGNANSISVNPGFVSNTDLHIPNGGPSGLESAAANVGVTSDIDGDVRPGPVGSVNGGGLLADIGADEFDRIPVEAVLPVVNYTALTSTCSAGDRVITATISDNVGIVTTGANMPRLYMKKNTGAYISAPGTLTAGDALSGTWTFTVSAAAFTPALAGGDQVTYFVVAQDAAGNLGGFPGAGITGTDVNTATPPTTPNVYNIFPSSGTYNVGTSGTYPTITSAINAYNTNTCISGHITYVLTDATYPTESFPITIANNPLAGPSATLTLRPAASTSVTVTGGTSSQSMFRFNDARYVTMDGVNTGGANLHLVSSNPGTNTCNIWLTSSGPGCKFITLKNMNITGGANIPNASPYANEWGILCGSTAIGGNNGNDNDNVTITGNTFLRCGYAVLVCGGAANTSTGGNDNWVVSNNIIGPATVDPLLGMGVNGMFFRNMVNLDISNNILRNTGNTVNGNSFPPAGFFLESGIERAMIRNNTIDGFFSSKTGVSQVIYFGTNILNSIISGNTFKNIGSNVSGWSPRVININTGNASSNDTIVNNIITDVWTNAGTAVASNWANGIYIEGTAGGLKIWHNSINLFGARTGQTGATGSACIAIVATGGNLDIRNNVLVNTCDNTSTATDKNYTIYSSVANTNFTNIDHNDYFVANASNVLGFIGSTDRTNIAGMQAGFGGNLHSVSVNPGFVSNTDLHIPAATISQLESGGMGLGVNTDWDGHVRPGPAGSANGGGLIPDIGADEFDGIIQDVVAPSIVYTPLLGACGNGDRTFTATITDASGVNSTTFKPRVYFKINSAGTWQFTEGTSLGGNVWSFTIQASLMPGLVVGNTVQYYVAAQDAASPTNNVGAQPGIGSTGTNVTNITAPTTPASYNVMTALGGDNLVGSAQPSPFNTLSGAINLYNTGCLTGHVTFILTDANYGVSEGFPLIINNSVFADVDHTLTIRPNAGVSATVTAPTSAGSTFKLLDARFVTIDGVNTGGASLTVVNTKTTAGAAPVWLASTTTGGCKNIAIKNTTITGGNNTITGVWGIIASANGTNPAGNDGMNHDNVLIEGNTFLKCGYAIWGSGSGFASATSNDNWQIKNNFIGPETSDNNLNMGVNAVFLRRMINLEVSGNLFRNIGVTGTTFGTAGLYIEGAVDRARVINNTITNLMSYGSGATSFGIYFGASGGVINSIVSGNTIKGLNNLSGAAGSMRGIYIHTGNNISNDTIVNNMISDVAGFASTTATSCPIGIGIETNSTGTGGVNVWYNTVNLFGSRTGSATSGAMTICMYVGTSGTNLDIRNNIFTNTYDISNQANEKAYAMYSTTGFANYSQLNFNNYFSNGSLAFLSSERTNMTAVQSFGGNTASFSSKPVFVSDNDLHLQQVNANLPMVAGIPLAVTTDFDGTPRNAITPFVGAHEAPKCSGALTAGTAVPVSPSLCVAGSTVINDVTSTPGIGVKLQWQSSPDSVLFTDISGATSETYTISPNITATTYYRMKADCIFSGNRDSASTRVVVYPLPAVITGNDGCVSYTTSLNSADAGGNWVSSNTTVATIGTNGVVTANTTGTTVISYTLPSTGCTRTRELTVNPLPVAIIGDTRICKNTTSDLENADANGTWTSSATGVATVEGTTGVVTGVNDGMTQITYTLPTGCFRAVSVSVDPLPALTVTSLTPTTVCLNESVSFNSSVPPSTFTLMSQDFNSGIDDWTMDNISGDPSAYWQLVPNGWDGSVGDGTPMMQAVGILTGQVNTVLTSGSFSTAGMGSASLTFNQYLLSDAGDATVAVEYSTDGGANWLPLANFAGMTIGDGTWSTTDNDTTIEMPAGALDKTDVKLRWNYNGFLQWFIDNVTVKGTLPPATYAWAGVGGASGVVCDAVTCATATVTPTVAGNNVYAATATSSAGCISTVNVTVSINPLPAAIGGTLSVCQGLTTTLTDDDPDGTWSSSTPSVATIGSSSGIVTGHDAGTSIVTYTLPTGCIITAEVTTNPLPASIAGATFEVCPAHTITLTDSDPDGTWSSSDATVADIDPTTGVILAGNAGTATITYTLPTTCIATATVTVNPLPDAIGGTLAVCKGLSTTLTDATTPGTWTSINTSVATIDATTGEATGVTDGTTTIVYALTTTGCAITAELTVNPLPAAIVGGSMHVCPGNDITFSNSDPDGTWSSSTVAIGTINATTGVATGITDGTTTITYTLPTTCISTAVLTVDPLPAPITGDMTVCEGLNTTLNSITPDGEWYSSNDLIATAGSTTGIISGVAAGTVTVSYVLPTTCMITAVVTVDPLPVAITGTMRACVNATTTLSNTDPDGTWSSGDVTIATIGSATGEMTGVAAGNTLITYTLPTGCITTTIVTTDPLPVVHNVSTGGSYCAGSTGVVLSMTNSEADDTYRLYHGATLVGTVTSVGGAFDFGTYTMSGTYTATATTDLGCLTDMAGAANIVITPTVLPEATIVMGPNDTVCEGQSATFTATPVNGGSAPAYQWIVNGTVVGGTSSYTYVPVNGDVVKVELTSNAVCPLPATVTSNALTAVVTHTLLPSVTIDANPGNNVCQFSNVLFTATPVNGGTTPTYAWTRNGNPVGGTGNTMVLVPNNGDVIVARLTSSYSCPSINNVASNSISMNVTNVFLPSVEINALPGLTSRIGQTVTLNAVVKPAGNTPTYQWYKNSTKLTGATTATYISADFANNDSVTCEVHGVGSCAYYSFNSVKIRRTTGMVEIAGEGNIRLVPNPNTGSFAVNGTIAGTTDEEVTMEVTNMLGQTVYTGKVTSHNGVIDHKVQLDNSLANGMYMLTVHAGDERKVFHFVLSK
ncbi:hypothetical protein GCM10023093_01900 [Nemorincola caseinilytica]|uniref:Ig-like domain-containing protein n=1 Tax=Nemorincola caseinilytica TaxID=2054315 RepID=A0ABP8N243_9BACT